MHPTEEVHPTASSIIELAIKSESNMDQFRDWQNVFKRMGLTRQTKKTLFINLEKAPNKFGLVTVIDSKARRTEVNGSDFINSVFL